MTRRAVLALFLAPLTEGGRADSPRVPLVAADEVLELSLDRTLYLGTREPGARVVEMELHEIGCFPLSLTISGEHGLSRADLERELARLLALVRSDVPLCDELPHTTLALHTRPHAAVVIGRCYYVDGDGKD